MEVDAAPELHRLRVVDPDAVHARLQCQVVPAHRARLDGALPVGERELDRVQRGHDVVLEQDGDGLDRGFGEHEHGRLDARLAQAHALLDRRHGEHVRTGEREHARALGGTVTVGIGLHHAAHALARRQQRLERAVVASQRTSIDLDPRPARLGLAGQHKGVHACSPSESPRTFRTSSHASCMASPMRSMRSVAMTDFSPKRDAAA